MIKMENIDDKKNFIQELYDQNSKFMHPNQARSQTKLLEIVSSDIYTDPKRFLIEMIQNADDASFERESLDLNITFCKNSMVISHQGNEFSKEDIISLCSAGNSTKVKKEKLTGYKGIGFKSIFANSTKVIIYSGGYSFRFDKNHFKSDKMITDDVDDVAVPWQIIPIWTEDREIESGFKNIIKDYKVNFIIFMNKEESVDECRNFIKEIEEDHMYFLFLKSKNLNFTVKELLKTITKISKKQTERIKIVDFHNNGSKIGSYYYDNYEVNIEKEFKPEILEIIRNNSQLPKKLIGLQNFEISFAIPIEDETINGELKVKALPKRHRIIYAFLPTKVNYNFPFLINSNFTLDAGRSQLMESSWNSELFRILPSFITKFQKNLFINFGNSFVESLISQTTISCKMFKDVFTESSLKEKELFSQDLKVLTSKNRHELLRECYFDSTSIDYKNELWKSILGFFSFIFEDPNHPNRILEEYFMKNKSLTYTVNYEISNKDRKNIDILSKYFDISYYHITDEEILSFIDSEEYVKYLRPIEIWRLLCVLSKSPLFAKLITGNNLRLPDVNYEFRKIDELVVPQINLNTEVERSFFSEIKVEEYKKFEINPQLLKTFIMQDDVQILKLLNMNFFNEDKKFEHIFNNFHEIYNKVNSIDVIQTMFKKWKDSDVTKQKEIIEKIKNLKDKYLVLTDGNLFISPHCCVIGKFYNISSIFDDYHDHSISKEYYIPGTNKFDWNKFFIDLEMWHEDKTFLLKMGKDTFDNMPFFDEKFKKLPEVRKKIQKDICFINVSPKINRIYDKSFQEICEFFKNNISFCNKPIQKEVKDNNFLNYFKWFFENKQIPTTMNNLLPIQKLLPSKILNSKIDIIKKILEDNLNFPKYEEIYLTMQDSFKRDKLKSNELILILEKIRQQLNFLTNKTDRANLSNFYFALCCELASFSIQAFDGYLLDESENLRAINELYHVADPEIEALIGHHLSRKYYQLKLPDDNDKTEFIKFCRKNKLKIYDKNTVTYSPHNFTENKEMGREMSRLKTYILKIIKMKLNYAFDPDSILKKIEIIKFYNCSKINIVTTWKDSFEHGICFIDSKKENINVYFLQDDVYSTWRHPTILHYLTEQLSIIFGCKELQANFITLFNLRTEEEIKKWFCFRE